MGSLAPFSITTNCTMKSLLIFATVLAVGLAEEAKAVVATAPYLYGYPGYGYAPVAYNNVPYTYAPAPDSRLPVHNPELPVAPVHDAELPEAPVYNGVAPEPVQDTPEVAAAKAEFAAAFEEVASRQKRESDPAWTYGYNSPWVLNSRYQPFYYNGIYANTRLAYMGYPGYAYGFYH